MKGYISIPQFVKLQGTVIFLWAFGGPIQNMVLFWAGAGLVSAVRLFYFGTYLPHKPRNGPNEVMAWAKARSARAPTALSFLRCYCFDMVRTAAAAVAGKVRVRRTTGMLQNMAEQHQRVVGLAVPKDAG